MIRLLIAGLASLVLGLNLMVIYNALRITDTGTLAVIDELSQIGLIVTIVGFTIIAVGAIRGLRGNLTPETSVILTAGSAVTVIGISTIVMARGHGSEDYVKDGAWVASIIGIALIAVYVIRRYKQTRRAIIASKQT